MTILSDPESNIICVDPRENEENEKLDSFSLEISKIWILRLQRNFLTSEKTFQFGSALSNLYGNFRTS